jgi:hypothetical protein
MRRSGQVLSVVGGDMGVAVMSNQPAAFMSYVRSDDEHDKGRITQFSEQLSAEVRAQSGAEFSIFVDRNDIGWGQNWQARIDESLETATLLVVIMTPALFRSRAARTEIESFLARERDLGRYDLILPVYYISTPELEDPHQREGDELARVLASRQFADWRHLRFEEFDSPTVRSALIDLAIRISTIIRRLPSMPSSRPGESRQEATQPAESDTTPTDRGTSGHLTDPALQVDQQSILDSLSGSAREAVARALAFAGQRSGGPINVDTTTLFLGSLAQAIATNLPGVTSEFMAILVASQSDQPDEKTLLERLAAVIGVPDIEADGGYVLADEILTRPPLSRLLGRSVELAGRAAGSPKGHLALALKILSTMLRVSPRGRPSHSAETRRLAPFRAVGANRL